MRTNEATIKAEFYHQSRLIGLQVIPELSTPVGFLDIAVLDPSRTHLLAIVEAKDSPHKLNPHSEQMSRYRRLGVPIYGLASLDDCSTLAANIKQTVTHGKPLSKLLTMQRVHKPRKSDQERLANYLARYNRRNGSKLPKSDLNIKSDRPW